MNELTPYAELADLLADLALLVRETRRARGLSLRDAASQSGCAPATISRLENGGDCSLGVAIALLRWMDTTSQTAGTE
jgi:ribosome-binding protein aMBF1 (putative translation factor)